MALYSSLVFRKANALLLPLALLVAIQLVAQPKNDLGVKRMDAFRSQQVLIAGSPYKQLQELNQLEHLLWLRPILTSYT